MREGLVVSSLKQCNTDGTLRDHQADAMGPKPHASDNQSNMEWSH